MHGRGASNDLSLQKKGGGGKSNCHAEGGVAQKVYIGVIFTQGLEV